MKEHTHPQAEEQSQQQAKRTKGLRPSRRQQDAEHLSEMTAAKAVRTKEEKDFQQIRDIEQGKVMDTLPRVTSIIEKEMIKNLTVQKDTETIHRAVKRGTKIS